MSGAQSSESWYRVAGLRPRLRAQVRVHRHLYRGETWYVLQDDASGRQHRLSAPAYALVGLLDGNRRVDAAWDAAAGRLGDDAPTQAQTVELLAQLHGADLVRCEVSPDTRELFERYRQRESARWRRGLLSPLAWRLPLLDPQRWLDRLVPLVRPLLGRAGALLWLTVVAPAAVLAVLNWDPLTADLAARVLEPYNLALLWLAYPLVKGVHETAHGVTTRAWGGQVHEAGLMVLVLVPVPYVDATASSAFPERHRRVLVAAAGVAAELFLAALALYLWISTGEGLVRALAFDVMLIGGVSTLLFNGNPLLRFDGYYVLADLLEIPNLGRRSQQYLSHLARRYLLGADDPGPATADWRERAWLVGYGLGSAVYRLFVTLAIALFVASEYSVVGSLLALWALLAQVGYPLARGARFLVTSPTLARRRGWALAVALSVAAGVPTLLALIPLPSSTRAEGVVWVPEESIVRAGTDGFVRALLVAPGARLERGQPVARLDDPFLEAQARILEARRAELQARFAGLIREDPRAAQSVRDELGAVEVELDQVRGRIEALVVRSPGTGRLVVPAAADLPGRFVKQGDLLVYVLDASRATARVVVAQSDVAQVRERTRGVEVKLADRLGETFPAERVREAPAADGRLPSATLGAAGGGAIAVDATADGGTRALQTLFNLDLALPADLRAVPFGCRVYVRFDHGLESLAGQWGRSLRQLFLERLAV